MLLFSYSPIFLKVARAKRTNGQFGPTRRVIKFNFESRKDAESQLSRGSLLPSLADVSESCEVVYSFYLPENCEASLVTFRNLPNQVLSRDIFSYFSIILCSIFS